MNSLFAFLKKEFLEQIRTGKLLIFVIIFCLFGIMSPAIAKLTPWMMEMMSEDLAESGFVVNHVDIDAMTSWTQYYKNMPIALIILLVMSGGILTAELQKGTLINVITKGLNRWKVIFSKTSAMCIVWTAGSLLSYGITYGYNAYFWDNGIAEHVFFAAFCFYLLGLWLITVIPFASAFLNGASAVILLAGGEFLAAYLLSLLPAVREYSPAYLMGSLNLLTGISAAGDYVPAVIVTVALMAVNMAGAVVLFNRRNI